MLGLIPVGRRLQKGAHSRKLLENAVHKWICEPFHGRFPRYLIQIGVAELPKSFRGGVVRRAAHYVEVVLWVENDASTPPLQWPGRSAWFGVWGLCFEFGGQCCARA